MGQRINSASRKSSHFLAAAEKDAVKSGFCPSGQLLQENCRSYARTTVWVWFKGGLDGGEWRGKFSATENAEHTKAVTLQHGDFKDCVVPAWRISNKEPSDLKKGPAIPADAKWKFSG